MIVEKRFNDVLDFRSEIHPLGFEPKKDVKDSDINQVIGELIATNIVSNYSAFIVLINLKDI